MNSQINFDVDINIHNRLSTTIFCQKHVFSRLVIFGKGVGLKNQLSPRKTSPYKQMLVAFHVLTNFYRKQGAPYLRKYQNT